MGRAVKVMSMATLVMSVFSEAHAAITYTLTDLGELIPNAQYSIGYSINEAGWVAGVAEAPGTTQGIQAFVYDPASGVTVLRDAPGASQVLISNTGVVAGSVGAQAFIYDHGTVKNVVGYGGALTTVGSISDAGVLIGTSTDPLGRYHGVQWNLNGQMTHWYQPLPEYQDLAIVGMNNHGTVLGVGYNAATPGARQAFIQSGNTVTRLPLLAGNLSYFVGINDRNEVAGVSADTEGNGRAVLVRDGKVIELGSPSLPFTTSWASAINNSGQVVGYVGGMLNHSSLQSAVLFEGDKVTLLASLLSPDVAGQWDLQFATDINDAGQIVGSGVFNGQVRAFLLTPVPEPGTFVLMGLGLIGLLTARRRVMAA
jgi:uncharacterized membrane protein